MPFKKGQSGNASGRPKGAKNKVDSGLKANLTEYSEDAEEQLMKAVKAGERWAIELWFAYVHGKPTQRVETEISGNTPIVIDLNKYM